MPGDDLHEFATKWELAILFVVGVSVGCVIGAMACLAVVP